MGRLSIDTPPPPRATRSVRRGGTHAVTTPWSRHALVVLRIALPAPTPDALARVTRLALTLGPGELLAVRSAVVWPDDPDAGPGLRRVACAFGPADHETLIWPAPPECEVQATPGVLDVRDLPPPLPLVATARAAAGLAPGETLAVTGADGSPLLVDFLAGRAEVAVDPDATGGVVVTRVRRL